MKLRPRREPFRLSLGERGEMLVWAELADRGYRILEKNYRCAIGEIDVIALRGKRLVFVEVKTRASHHFGRPEEAVGPAKQHKLIQLAKWYLKEHRRDTGPVSFMVAAVTWEEGGQPEIRLIENAFTADV